MGKKKDQKQTTETKRILDPKAREAFLGEGGLLPEAREIYEKGGFAATSKHDELAKQKFDEAATARNPLLDPAMDAAKGFMAAGGGQNLGLEGDISNQIGLLADMTQKGLNYHGSPGGDGVVSERMGAAMAPAQAQALGQDFQNRERRGAEFALAAPQLGSAPRQQAAQQAGFRKRIGDIEVDQALTPYKNLQRYGGLLDLAHQKTSGGTNVTTTPGGSRAAGALGGGLSGLSTGNPLFALGGAALGAMG